MPLIKQTDIVTLKRYVRINYTATAVNSMPDLDAAERKFLIPILTQTVFDGLQTQVDSNAIVQTALLNLCRAAVAPLAVWLDLPFIQSQLGDDGLKTTHSDNREAAHQWEYNRVEIALVNKGMAALEDLLIHLIANAETYSWDNAAAKESFIRTGTEFSRYAYLSQPNLTFQQLKPLMVEVEDHFIKSAIGDEFFAELRDAATPGTEQKIAIQLIKKAIVQYTLVRSTERLPVKITPNGIMASLQNNLDVPEREAGNPQLEILKQSAQRDADAYQVQLIQYLNKTATDEIFTTYKNSEFYTPPVTKTCDPNDHRRGVCAF